MTPLFTLKRQQQPFFVFKNVGALMCLVVALALLVVSISIMEWYRDDQTVLGVKTSTQIGIFRYCRQVGGSSGNSARLTIEQCANLVDDVRRNGTFTNNHNGCSISGDVAATRFQVAQAFSVIACALTLLLLLAGVIFAFVSHGPRFFTVFMLLLIIGCGTVTTAVFYQAVTCIFASSTSSAAASLVLFWVGVFMAVVGGLILMYVPREKTLLPTTNSIVE